MEDAAFEALGGRMEEKDLLKKNTASRRKANLHAFAKKAGVKLA